LFSAFWGSAERIIRNEGRTGEKLNKDKNTIKKGKLLRKLSSLACPFFCS